MTLVYDEYDIILEAYAENIEELNGFISNSLKSPRAPTTMIVISLPKKK